THEEHFRTINHIKKARQELGLSVAIMLDTKGPEVRIGKIRENQIQLSAGDHWLLVKEQILGDLKKISIHPPFVLDILQEGTRVLFNDGYISSKVVQVTPDGVMVKIENGG